MRHVTRRPDRTSRLVPALLAVIAVVVAACGSTAATSAPAASAPAASAQAPAGPLELAGTSWRLTKYLSPDGSVFTVPAAVTPSAAFTATEMSGSSGCNTFNAPYTLGAGNAKDGQDLTLGPAVSTKMACDEPMATVENAYMTALGVVDKAALLEDGSLQLWDSAGKTTLVYIKAS